MALLIFVVSFDDFVCSISIISLSRYAGFGEDAAKMDEKAIRLFWERLKLFSDNVSKAHADNEELSEKLRKAEEAEAKKAAKAAKKAVKVEAPTGDEEEGEKGSVFDQFAAARSGNADDIVANIRAGRKGMRRKK